MVHAAVFHFCKSGAWSFLFLVWCKVLSISWFDIPMNVYLVSKLIWIRIWNGNTRSTVVEFFSCLKIQGTEHYFSVICPRLWYITFAIYSTIQNSSGSPLSLRTCSLFVSSILMTILSVPLSVLSSISITIYVYIWESLEGKTHSVESFINQIVFPRCWLTGKVFASILPTADDWWLLYFFFIWRCIERSRWNVHDSILLLKSLAQIFAKDGIAQSVNVDLFECMTARHVKFLSPSDPLCRNNKLNFYQTDTDFTITKMEFIQMFDNVPNQSDWTFLNQFIYHRKI